MADGRTSADSRVEMRELVLPSDANVLGNLLGGRVMHLIDLAGFFAANRHSRQRCVTASIDHLDFLHPIRVGQAVLLEAQVVAAGRTSMDVRVKVRSEDLLSGEQRETTTAWMTFVAVDASGKPVPVPALVSVTDEDKAARDAALARRRERQARTAK